MMNHPQTEAMLPSVLSEQVQPHLPGPIDSIKETGGGCIANASRIEAAGEAFFLKWGEDDGAETFEVEAAGLEVLSQAGTSLLIPEPIAARNRAGTQPGFLLMSYIEPGRMDASFWEKLGRGLAELHRSTEDRYGLDHDNRIGRLPQENAWKDAWPTFFRENRLAPQVEMAREAGRWSSAWDKPLEHLYALLEELLPDEPPASLLHGDLWSGNVMAAAGGQPALIDPAVYYGHRETDLAMSELFGGFDGRFYDAYDNAWPMEPGYNERKRIYNLYHLINHLNHFGEGYAGQVQTILSRFD